MSAADNSGSAFPCPESADKWGMTLRDYFAAKAMQVYLADRPDCDDFDIAMDSYCVADAMLAERAK